MKRLISVILTVTLFLSAFPLPIYSAGIFSDTAGTWAETAIDRWSSYGIIEGYAGEFKPGDELTRAQMATILCRLLALTETSEYHFSDVKETDWYAPYINRCFTAEILLGDDGKAMPDDAVTREQAMVLLGRAFGIQPMENADLNGYRDSGEISDWALGYAGAMVDAGIIKGTSDDTISPKKSIDRASTMTILDRAIGDYVNVDGVEIESVNRGIVLVVADNVKITGVDEGRTVIVGAGADGVTVNGMAMKAGTLTVIEDNASAYPDLTIEQDGESISGGEYQDIVIASSVGNGDVTLDNVTIHGALIVRGGGSDSIHLNECEVESILIDKETADKGVQEPRIELNHSSIQTIEAVKPAIIEAAGEDSVIHEIEAKSDVTVQGENTVVLNIVTAADNVKLTVKDASIEKITAENPVIVESTGENSMINVIEAKNDVTVQGKNTQIQAIEVPKDTDQAPVIDVQNGVVLTVNAENPVEIRGDGKVENVTAAAEVTVDSKTVATITVTEAVTVNITGTDEIEVAVETEEAVNISSQNENISVTTTKEEVSVTINNEGVEHIHKWREDAAQYTAPTCSAEGKRVYVCDGDGECDAASRTKTEILEKLPHTEIVIPAAAVSCTSTGLTEGKKCSVCQTVLVEQQVIPMLGHSFTEVWSSDETNHWHECQVCGAKADYASHIPGAAATEESAQFCTECGRVLAAELGHICKDHLSRVEAAEASCETAGNNEYYACTCGKFYSDVNAEHLLEEGSWVLSPTGHTYGSADYEWLETDTGYTCTATRICEKDASHVESETVEAAYAVTDAATCIKTGTGIYTASFTNSAFAEQTKTIKINYIDHTEEAVTGYAATCTENGLTDGKRCSVCQAMLVEQQVIPMLGHSFAEVWSSDETNHWHACTREGCTEVTDKTAHTPDAAATEETAQTCTECGYVLVPATGHLCKNHLIENGEAAATCETAGNSAYWSCTCGKFYSDANAEHLIEENSWVLAPTGHSYGTVSYEWQENDTGYTCTATCICANDTSHVKIETVEAAYAVTETATCAKAGEATYTADFYNSDFEKQTKTVEIFSDAHEYGGWISQVNPNGETDGVLGHYHCSVCGKDFDENHNELTSLVIPAGPENFGGAKLSILTDTSGKQLLAMEETGDTVNDAIFKRAKDIEEMHNVHIMESTGNDAARILQTAYMAGDFSYDTAMIPDTKVSSLFLKGYLKSFHELEIDFDKPWWDSSRNVNEQFNFRINNKDFLAAITGPYDLSYYDSHSMVVFNKGLRSSLGIEDDFYQKVRDFRWTIDQMDAYATLAKSDINGDESMTPDIDRFGIVGTFDNFYDSFLAGANVRYVDRDQNTGKLSWSIANNANTSLAVVDKLLNLEDGKKSYTSGRTAEDAPAKDVFVEGRSLFFTTTLGDIPALREAVKGNFEIGYLPVPIFSDKQQKQYSNLAHGGLMTVVPTYIKENARVHRLSVLLDTFASYSKDNVVPAYLDRFIPKSTGDMEKDVEMLDICLNCSTYDLGLSLFKDSDPVTSIKNGIFAGRSNNFVSVTEKYNITIESQLSGFEAQLAELGS